jgi:hypothetical protein
MASECDPLTGLPVISVKDAHTRLFRNHTVSDHETRENRDAFSAKLRAKQADRRLRVHSVERLRVAPGKARIKKGSAGLLPCGP